jgi:hypothetical protein
MASRGSAAARAGTPRGEPPGLSDMFLLLRGEWTFAKKHLAMQRKSGRQPITRAVLNQQVAIEDRRGLPAIGRAEYASLISVKNSPKARKL